VAENEPLTAPHHQSRNWYARLRLLSLDVMVGALGGGWMVSTWLGQEMSWAFYVVLPLAVWNIYTLDHLLDARRLKEGAGTPRHIFHYRYFNALFAAVIVLSVLCLLLAAAFLGRQGVYFGMGMSGLVLLHLLLVKVVGDKTSPLLIKESGVALVYCAGVWGLPVLEAGAWTRPEIWVAFGQFFLLALINLLEFSLYEVHIDERDGHSSFVRAIGKKGTRILIAALLGLFLPGAAWLLSGWELPQVALQMVFFLMAAVLSALLVAPRWFEQHERYRSWGDGAFLLPFLYPLCLWLM
jgi:hypothetical protein